MSNLSNEQIAKLQSAVNSDDAIQVLACLMVLFPTKRSGQFVSTLAALGKADTTKAELIYGLAIVLYDKYFPEEHRGALSALCDLARLLEARGHEPDIHKMIEATYPLVIRAARGIGRPDVAEGNGKGARRFLATIYSEFECDQ